MRELQKLLQRFLAREIELEDLQRGFAAILEKDPDIAAPAAAWLDAGEQDGMLSSAVCTSLKSVIVSHLAANSDGPDPRDSGVFGPDDFGARDARPPPDKKTAVSAKPAKTLLINRDKTTIGAEDATRIGDASKTRLADHKVTRVDTVLKIGSVVGDRYELQSQLGSGGMGTVFKAHDRLRAEAQDRKPHVALKVLSDQFKEHPDSMIALQRETRRAQSMAHPNVITVHEFFKDGPHYYLTMELLHGHPLDHLLRTKLNAAMPIEEAWPIIEGVGKALQYGHEQGIVHSDIKPGNIFICTNSVVKVLDFGISRPIPLSDVPETEQTVFDARKRLGTLTPSYASLEMWYEDTPDPRDDIYSLAVVSYLLLSGRHPFDGRSAKTVFEEKLVPERITTITFGQWSAIARGLKLRRRNRIRTVTEFLNLLSPDNVERSRRRVLALLGVLLVVTAIGIGLNYYRMALEDRMLENPNGVAVPAEPVEVTPEQQVEIDDLLTLARFDFDSIDENASANDLEYLLNQGHNSVLELVETVLAINPHDEAAQQMKQDVFDLYSRKAEEYFEQSNYESAWLMARNAQDISNKRAIRNLLSQICDRAPDVCER